MFFDLIEKELKEYYITDLKIGIILFLVASFVLSMLSFFEKSWFIIAIILFCVVILLFVLLNYNKKKYGKKVFIDNQDLIVYNYYGKKERTIILKDVNSCILNVGFEYRAPYIIYKECILLYLNLDFELYEKMEYRSYWKDKNLLIIQNPLLIDEIKKIIKCQK